MRRLSAVVAVIASLAPAPALADPAAARALFDRGTSALEEGRFPEGRDLLQQSLALHPHAATAFNLIVALRGTEQPTEAVRHCGELLAGSYGQLTDDRRAQATEICRGAEEERARIEIVVTGAPRATIRIDGERVGELAGGEVLERFVDPGRHVIAVSSSGRAAAERTVRLERGGTLRTTIPLFELAAAPPELPPPADDTVLHALLTASGAVLVVGAIVGIVIGAILVSEPLPPHTSPLFPEPVTTFAP